MFCSFKTYSGSEFAVSTAVARPGSCASVGSPTLLQLGCSNLECEVFPNNWNSLNGFQSFMSSFRQLGLAWFSFTFAGFSLQRLTLHVTVSKRKPSKTMFRTKAGSVDLYATRVGRKKVGSYGWHLDRLWTSLLRSHMYAYIYAVYAYLTFALDKSRPMIDVKCQNNQKAYDLESCFECAMRLDRVRYFTHGFCSGFASRTLLMHSSMFWRVRSVFEWPGTMLAAKSHWTRLWHVRLQIARDCYNRNVAMSAFKTSIGIRLAVAGAECWIVGLCPWWALSHFAFSANGCGFQNSWACSLVPASNFKQLRICKLFYLNHRHEEPFEHFFCHPR